MRDEDLEDIFAQARALSPPESGAVLARVLDDAARHQPPRRVRDRRQIRVHRPGFWAGLALAVGGRGVLAGLASVALAGAMFGYTQPASLSSLAVPVFEQPAEDEVDLFAGVDDYLIEG